MSRRRPKKSAESKHLSRLLRANEPEGKSALSLDAKREGRLTRGSRSAKRRKGARQ